MHEKAEIIRQLKRINRIASRDLGKYFRSLGFVPMATPNPYTEAWKHPELKLVLKKGLFLGHAPKNLRVPTVILKPELRSGRVWVCQPLVDKHHRLDALTAVESMLKERKRKTFVDVHEFNVGWYKGNAVLFDW